jgi:MFS transporter, MHS family, proline/betaine transporter
LAKAGYSGVLPSLLSEQFVVERLQAAARLSLIFGGLAPLVATSLIAATGDSLSPSYYLIFTALLSLVALMAIQKRSARLEPSRAPTR